MRRRPRSKGISLWVIAAVIAMAMVTAVCAAPHTSSTPRGSEPPPLVHAPHINWDDPIGGDLVGSIAEAAPLVPFDVYAPKKLGDPAHIYVTTPPVAWNDGVVAFIYRLDSEGHCTKGCVVVEENFPDGNPTMSLKDYDAAHQDFLDFWKGKPEYHGVLSIVSLHGDPGAEVTVSDGGETTVFFWYGGLEYIVWGPGLQQDDALAIADSL